MEGADFSSRVARIVLSRLGGADLKPPSSREREPEFTARSLMPPVREALRQLDIPGLTLAGDGAATPPVTTLPSCEFRPDIALLYQRARLIAFEVKFLRSSARQYSLAAALGQAVIYRSQGFDTVGVILVDLAPVLGEPDAVVAMVTKLGLLCHVYTKSGNRLISQRSQAAIAGAPT